MWVLQAGIQHIVFSGLFDTRPYFHNLPFTPSGRRLPHYETKAEIKVYCFEFSALASSTSSAIHAAAISAPCCMCHFSCMCTHAQVLISLSSNQLISRMFFECTACTAYRCCSCCCCCCRSSILCRCHSCDTCFSMQKYDSNCLCCHYDFGL